VITITEKLRFITDVFGASTHDSSYENVSVTCPWCVEKTGSTAKKKLAIHIQTWKYHCWKCGARGRTIVPALFKLGARDCVQEFISKFASPESGASALSDALEANEKPVARLPDDFMLLASCAASASTAAALAYLYNRGLTQRDIWFFKLGFSAEPDFVNRIIVPSHDAFGALNYYVARKYGYTIVPRKYMNCAVPRSDIVFNEINVDWSTRVTLVEGVFDAMKCGENAIPLLGCVFNESSLLFERILDHTTPITIMLDADAERNTLMIASHLASYDIDVNIATVPAQMDPGDMSHDSAAEAISNAIPWSRDWAMRQRVMNM